MKPDGTQDGIIAEAQQLISGYDAGNYDPYKMDHILRRGRSRCRIWNRRGRHLYGRGGLSDDDPRSTATSSTRPYDYGHNTPPRGTSTPTPTRALDDWRRPIRSVTHNYYNSTTAVDDRRRSPDYDASAAIRRVIVSPAQTH